MIPSPYEKELNGCRVVILVERRAFSNEYEQLSITQEQFKQISDFIWHLHPLVKVDEDQGEIRNITTQDTVIKLPDEISCWYEGKKNENNN